MNPRTSILTALLLALGALTSLPVASADVTDDLAACSVGVAAPACVAKAILCTATGYTGDTRELNDCICSFLGGQDPGQGAQSCIQNCQDPDVCQLPAEGSQVCGPLQPTDAQTPPGCLIEFVTDFATSCTSGEPPCDAGSGAPGEDDVKAILDSLCPEPGPGVSFPECYAGDPPGQDEIMDALNELCEDRPGEFPTCFGGGGPNPTECPPESSGDFPTCHAPPMECPDGTTGAFPTCAPEGDPTGALNELCAQTDFPNEDFPGCVLHQAQEQAPTGLPAADEECSNPTSGADDNIHTVLCIVTTALGETPAFDVTYANTAQVYPGTVGDNDGRMDYAIITVMGPDAGKDPVLTDDGCGVFVTDDPNAGLDGDGTDCLGPLLRVTLLIDLDNGGNGYEDPADGPIVRIESPVDVVPAPLYYDERGLDLGTVHIQDPRKGNHIYTHISDLDNDGWTDLEELCGGEPSNPTNPLSTCDDKDGDGLDFDEEEAAGTAYDDYDTDGDGLDDGSDPNPLFADKDGDGIADGSDNCPNAANANQLNTDGDSQGNACDADDDNDGWTDAEEAAATPPTDPLDPNSHPEPEPEDPPIYEEIIAMVEEEVNGILEDVENLDPEALAGQLQREIDNTTRDVNNATEDLSGQINDLVETIEDSVPTGVPDPLVLGSTDCDDPDEITTSPDCQSDGTVPGDSQDPHDVDGDNNRAEPNNQVDLVELRVAYVDLDEAADSSREKNGDLEGTSGATLVVWDATKSTGTELFRLHAGNSGRGGDAYPIEAFVLEQGPRNAPTQVVCVYRQGTTPFVAVNAGSYNPDALTHPCGPPVSVIAQINNAGALVGSVWEDFMTTEPRPFLLATDANSDGVPEEVRVNIPNPASCDPEAMTCSGYTEQIVPVGGVPDLNDLCGATGSFPTCLVPAPDCADNPPSCAPPPPECVEEDPATCIGDVPDLSELLGEVIPPCATQDPSAPVYVCQSNNPGLLGKQIVIKDPTGSITRI